ncbi:MAG: hypothetical protein ACREV4_05220 [Gammaproteobacteria bacterium]
MDMYEHSYQMDYGAAAPICGRLLPQHSLGDGFRPHGQNIPGAELSRNREFA